ncbi:hypothetical protein AOL_s00088g31 [Orbilia oligospora ATCC 24927]|uniref:Uncharacterized protein n=1 Tax=Arthrobotrys oligospora (strain ATCC 24927 / CBS 115.81 / DSM 1491) TaxID=756982 RepID=G1XHR8_ARTOA|nr:hypothetical protein AOL_s00088g31 [Orbilia oligospora ATCC 24927]EGX47316.1 hypothetical protein AOL_s00088g31 [Orbilia oligospora ATCC 24927]
MDTPNEPTGKMQLHNLDYMPNAGLQAQAKSWIKVFKMFENTPKPYTEEFQHPYNRPRAAQIGQQFTITCCTLNICNQYITPVELSNALSPF